MPTGKVKWFNSAKGYGFITTEDGKEAFVHYSDIGGEGFRMLEEGDDVVFDLADGPKGSKALNVQKRAVS